MEDTGETIDLASSTTTTATLDGSRTKAKVPKKG
jgi:hypothetical protein